LDVLRAQTLERTRKDNLQRTRSHLEQARLLAAVGSAGPSDVYRWESEIATNRKDAIDANATRNLAEIQVNRILHRPAEEPFDAKDATVDDSEHIGLASVLPDFSDNNSFRVLRDFIVEEGLAASPELRELDAAIDAARRAATSASRAFYLPSIGVQGSYSRLWWKEGAGTEAPAIPGLPRANNTDWSIGLRASYPVLRGGGRLATRSRTIEQQHQLELDREATSERIEQRIRSAMHRAGASYAGIREARLAEEWSSKNLQVVSDQYARGAVSLVTLLDAQNAEVVSSQAAANAVYTFLDDHLEVQRAVGRFDFEMTDAERTAFRDRLRAFAARAGLPPSSPVR